MHYVYIFIQIIGQSKTSLGLDQTQHYFLVSLNYPQQYMQHTAGKELPVAFVGYCIDQDLVKTLNDIITFTRKLTRNLEIIFPILTRNYHYQDITWVVIGAAPHAMSLVAQYNQQLLVNVPIKRARSEFL